MDKYDIKHPLRGEKYEKAPVLKQKFTDRILSVAGNDNSYLGYKKDHRKTMDTSKMMSEEYVQKGQEADSKTKIILKYRMYGRDGINQHELEKLVKWGIITKRNPHAKGPEKIKTKKRRTMTRIIEETGIEEEWSEEVSGEGDDKYDIRVLP